MQRGLDCLSGSKTTAGLVSLDAFARPKNATPSPPRSSHFHPWWCTPRVLLGCLGAGESTMVINVGLYAACFLSLYVLNTTKPK